MKICLDTNAYRAFKEGNADAVRIMEEAESVFMPTVVLGELYSGFYSGNRIQRNIEELHAFLDIQGVEEAAVTHAIAERYGRIISDLQKKGKPVPTNDAWIAATVLETGSRLLTRDKHFGLIPGVVAIPF